MNFNFFNKEFVSSFFLVNLMAGGGGGGVNVLHRADTFWARLTHLSPIERE